MNDLHSLNFSGIAETICFRYSFFYFSGWSDTSNVSVIEYVRHRIRPQNNVFSGMADTRGVSLRRPVSGLFFVR